MLLTLIFLKDGQGKIKYIINTHHHDDHTRGNVIAGPGTRIIGLQDVKQLVRLKNVKLTRKQGKMKNL